MRLELSSALHRAAPKPSPLPMAARRAFEVAGIHVSLASFQALEPDQQRRFTALGSAYHVSVARVAALVCKLELRYRLTEPVHEPRRGRVPHEVALALGIDRALRVEDWDELTPLQRYTLVKLASHQPCAKLRAAYAEISSRMANQLH